MKPILICLALLPAAVLGQWQLSVFGGAGLGRLPTDLMPATGRGETQKIFFGTSWSAGLQVRHVLSGPLHFATGIHWTCISGRDEYWIGEFMPNSAERRLGYVSLPMLVEVDAWRLQLGAGFQCGYLAAQKGRFIRDLMFVPGSTTVTETRELGLRAFDIGLAARLTTTIAERWNVGIRFFRGLADIKDHTDGQLSPLWTQQLIAVVAYRILPKGRRSKQGSPSIPEPDPAD
ncbi:MAG TPA: hypothetical protein PKE21_16520 [Flavobacteriales bacterium]|nr:hypothetical protein [Flavobacteriales bacterium]HMR29083.1 hypothetical protein [Flavobacteriales bacterium]